MSDISPQGTLTSSEISQRPQHGTLKMVDKDTWTYVPTAGYRGPDTFVDHRDRAKHRREARHIRAQLQGERQVAVDSDIDPGFVRDPGKLRARQRPATRERTDYSPSRHQRERECAR